MITGLLVRSCAEKMSRALQAGEANTSPVEANVRHFTVAGLDCGAPCPPVSSHRRAEARAGPEPERVAANSYSPCQTAQSSLFPPRVAAPGFCFSLSIHPMRGERSAERRSISVVARFGARRSALIEARRVPRRRDARLSALHRGDFRSGAALPSPAFLPDLCSELLAARSLCLAGGVPDLPGPWLRAAAAGRHSPLRLRHVSGDGPSDERGCAQSRLCACRSQAHIVVVSRVCDVVTRLPAGSIRIAIGVRPGGGAGPAHAPKVKRVPTLVVTSSFGMRRRMASMKSAPEQCIGMTTSGASAASSLTVRSM
jgi:hypothetical protein